MNINQPFEYILKLCLLTTILNGLTVNIVAAEVQTLGQAGRHEIDGRPGRDGISASDQKIRASQQLQTVDLPLQMPKPSATSGEHASECQQPKIE